MGVRKSGAGGSMPAHVHTHHLWLRLLAVGPTWRRVGRGQSCDLATEKDLALSQPHVVWRRQQGLGGSSGTAPDQQRMSWALSGHAGKTCLLHWGLTGRKEGKGLARDIDRERERDTPPQTRASLWSVALGSRVPGWQQLCPSNLPPPPLPVQPY